MQSVIAKTIELNNLKPDVSKFMDSKLKLKFMIIRLVEYNRLNIRIWAIEMTKHWFKLLY